MSPAIDYRDPLLRYIANIIDNEGIDYIGQNRSVPFSEADETELNAISQEACKRYGFGPDEDEED